MKYKEFRDFKITRTCTKNYKNYKTYKSHLAKDFQSRCAYCNLLDKMITTSFEVDHFIPSHEFEGICDELDTNYNNLVYSCKKCNIAKSNQFKGKINPLKIENEYFYNPIDVDYNTIFYRDEIGAINSDDDKGRDMIARLKLYRPIHNLAWLCEELLKMREKIKEKLENDSDKEKIAVLEKAKDIIDDYYIECSRIFTSNYNNTKMDLDKLIDRNAFKILDKL
ncbi:5-methylcytosine-specific restriction endonuclease McrA [Clostridium beijerinckii]|uniref:HNH endonuclease signature motif containing protein n=1 Tax=Clostridium beijerinckii TaxID=1520 RepID=UPI001494393B|nr:HNH endonuclease signature motif containing protein [Clostridium beijerinckii]NOW93119.1 5-methylcytosine-specific restriction endonuclease McrA [Clostridium beijerinckii]